MPPGSTSSSVSGDRATEEENRDSSPESEGCSSPAKKRSGRVLNHLLPGSSTTGAYLTISPQVRREAGVLTVNCA